MKDFIQCSCGEGKDRRAPNPHSTISAIPTDMEEKSNIDMERSYTSTTSRRSFRSTLQHKIAICFSIVVISVVLLSKYIAENSAKQWYDVVGKNLRLNTQQVMEQDQHFTIDKETQSYSQPLPRFGTNLSILNISDSDYALTPELERLDGRAFNLAILRLPLGSRWQYIGVCRGPRNLWSGENVKGTTTPPEIGSLLGFGLNRSDEGKFYHVSKISFLHIPTRSSFGCGGSAHNRGPEDPRLYWSDNNCPMMTFGYPSLAGKCRGIGLVHDIRSVWPELVSILAVSRTPSKAKEYIAGDFGDEIVELTKTDAHFVEKNWMPFFPGAVPGRSHIMPYIHYSSWPEKVLKAPDSYYRNTSNQIAIYKYDDATTEAQANASTSCVARLHPHMVHDIHGATPLYRLTLCPRGDCQPTMHNTVFVALNNIKLGNYKNNLIYGRYFTFWNVSAPFAPVLIGPTFRFRGTDDTDIVYSMSLTFAPRKSQPRLICKFVSCANFDQATITFGPSHGFLDDNLFVGLGLGDRQVATIEMSLQDEVIRPMRLCDS